MSKSVGAPSGNTNAASHKLYSQTPTRYVIISSAVSLAELANFASDLADGALWIAETLAEMPETAAGADQTIALYAAVAAELHQVAAEIEGKTGIKGSALGELSNERFDLLLEKQAKAMELILNQIITAYKRLQDGEFIRAAAIQNPADGAIMPSGLLVKDDKDWVLNPILKYMAGQMRSAKRIMREFAANLQWKAGGNQDSDLVSKIMKAIRESSNETES